MDACQSPSAPAKNRSASAIMPFEMASHDLLWKSLGKRASTASNAVPTCSTKPHHGIPYRRPAVLHGQLVPVVDVDGVEAVVGVLFLDLAKGSRTPEIARAPTFHTARLIAVFRVLFVE